MNSAADPIAIASDALSITIARCGAELQRIVDAEGRDLLWDGDPAWWVGRAPFLFPIVGALNRGEYRLGERTYRLPKHGFARVSTFEPVEQSGDRATLRLRASEDTRAQYPFDFTLDIAFAVEGAALRIEASVANGGGEPMPMSFGFHPALRWPLPCGAPREAHVVEFAEPETSPTFRWDAAGLVTPLAHPNPVGGRTLHPTDALFAEDAVFFPAPASRSLWYGAPGTPGVRLDWQVPELGIWTKPGAHFVCIEPWQGHNDPQGFDRDFRAKPGIVEVAPGGTWRTEIRLTFGVERCHPPRST